MSKQNFLSNSNYFYLHKLLCQDIQQKFTTNIIENASCRNILLQNMNQIHQENPNKNLLDLNRDTIRKVGPLLYKFVKNNSKSKIEKNEKNSRNEKPICQYETQKY